jgi:peptidoglycan/LPS O-acetylase OafA/YrhL
VLHDPTRIYLGTDTQAWGLLLGSFLAVLARHGLREVRWPAWTTWALVAALVALTPFSNPDFGRSLVSTTTPLLAVVLVWLSCSQKALAWPALRYVGRRSYALYLWHFPLIIILRGVLGPSLWTGIVAVALSLGFAELSWRCVEEPLGRTPRRRGAARTPMPALRIRGRAKRDRRQPSSTA